MSELYESQVRWRAAFDEMHERAMKAEAQLAEAREALDTAAGRMATAACAVPRPTRSDFQEWAVEAMKARDAIPATLSKIGGNHDG